MISEILTGVFAGVTVGYLWARDRHYRKSPIDRITDNKHRMRAMAGIEPVDSAASKHTKDEPFWWQKGEHQKMVMSRGKLPETQVELEKYLQIQKQELKRDEHLFYLDQEMRQQRQQKEDEEEAQNRKYVRDIINGLKKQ